MTQDFHDTTVPVLAGLTPRGITELFNILDRDSGKYTFSVSCYMLELYQDDLADLLLPASQKQQGPQKVLNQSESLFGACSVLYSRVRHCVCLLTVRSVLSGP